MTRAAAGTDFLGLHATSAPTRGLTSWLTATLREAVLDGRLAPGARLPATRTLATDLGIARGVAVEAYQRLLDEGLLSARPGVGTVVLPSGKAPEVTAAPAETSDDPDHGVPRLVVLVSSTPGSRPRPHPTRGSDQRPPLQSCSSRVEGPDFPAASAVLPASRKSAFHRPMDCSLIISRRAASAIVISPTITLNTIRVFFSAEIRGVVFPCI